MIADGVVFLFDVKTL